MTLWEIKEYINYQVNITKSGNQLSPDEYNKLLEAQYLMYFRRKVKEYRQRQINNGGNLAMFFYDLIPSLIAQTNITGGTGSISSIGAWIDAYGTVSGIPKRVELIDEIMLRDRINNLMARPLEYFPACILRANQVIIYPSNITPVTVIYYTKPSQPVYDYYINADGKEVYLTEGQTGVTVPSGGSSSSGVDGVTIVNSSTNELDFPEDWHEDFSNYLLGIIGIKVNDINVVQIAESKKNEL